MRYRKLGRTELEVSELGFGSWQLTNSNEWVGSTKEESTKALELALESGVNFIDTAMIYGNGLSERWIGEALRDWKGKRPYLATKIYPKRHTNFHRHSVPIEEAFPERWIHDAVDQSLKNIGTDCIDIMQFHVWEDSYADTEYWKTAIKEIIGEGKVRFWGISLYDYKPMSCVRTLDTGLISTVQLIFNVFHQAPLDTILPIAKSKGVGIIARVPLDEGGLGGKIGAGTRFQKGDFRAHYFAGSRKKELDKRLRALRSVSENETGSLPELALRYILSSDAVSTTIPGMRRQEYVRADVAAVEKGPLSPALLQELRKHAWERNFYRPPLWDFALGTAGRVCGRAFKKVSKAERKEKAGE
jgi:aryl-alcohol dehydrogenase-like predicted oxidoreductase